MKQLLIKFTFFIVISFCLSSQVSAQTFHLSEEQKVSVTGTSTLHDWNVTIAEVGGLPPTIDLNSNLPSFSFSAQVKSMDGGRGASMNGKIQKALKSNEYPQVTYVQTNEAEMVKSENGIAISSIGNLSLAGMSKEVSIDIMGTVEEGTLKVKGSYPIKMTDFGIEPPSAMFGQIETDDDVVVTFEVVYTRA